MKKKAEGGWLAMTPRNQTLKTLTTRSNFAVLLRSLYRLGLDYCVLPPGEDFRGTIIFTKDQLVSLIERGSPETAITDIPKRVAQGLFKPVAILESDSSDFLDCSSGEFASGQFASKGGFEDLDELQVLVVDDAGAVVSPLKNLKKALTPKAPSFPAWWEAPVPFAMRGKGVLHVNNTAMLMFGADLKRLAAGDFPDKEEFLVTLEGKPNSCAVTFRRLEEDIFMLDDCTSDVAAAADITWWAAVGKAWAATLDQENLAYRRCGESEAEALRAEGEKGEKGEKGAKTVLPCKWEGELLGYLCIEKKPEKKAPRKKKKAAEMKKWSRHKPASLQSASEASEAKNAPPANAPLAVLGPQAMGFLAPGAGFEERPHEKKLIADSVEEPIPHGSAKAGRK
jgi:hypothetical protein